MKISFVNLFSSGQRKAKLEAKKIRDEKEEQYRQQQDIEEAIYKAAERKKAIQHAKTLTFAQTDRVKGFHGALILTEVLKVWFINVSRRRNG